MTALVVINRQIAEIFQLDNIIEYKSPTDSLSVNDFYWAFAKAYIHKALANVELDDMTLSFVTYKHPRELFLYLRKKRRYTVEERYPGVFSVTGEMMQTQIIDIRKLSEEDNYWLCNLNRNLPGENLRRIISLEQKYGDRLNLGAYLYAVLTANQEKLNKEDFLMLTARTRKIIEEIGWGEQLRQKGRKEGIETGIETGKLEDARAMIAEGFNIEIISRVTKIPIKELKAKLSIK
jgi:hypothetical protein